MKEPFGMERLLSSANLAVSERSQVTRALAPGRSIGLQIAGYRAHMSWQFGLFREESQSSDATDAVTTRLSWAPVQTEHDVLHLGAALSQRWHRGDPFQIREEAELFSADSVLRSPRIDAVDRTLGGLELAWLHRSFSMSAEAMAQQVSDHDGVNWRFGGQYVQLGCLLTGEQRAYRKGLLKGVVPRHAFGAWELVVRHSHLDARDHARGSVSKLTLLGLNAHFPNHFKLTLSLLEAKITGELRSPQDRGKALSLSVQARL
jgi:phosphate-selective porin OprO/OprP